MHYRFQKTLLSVTTATDEDQDGDTYAIIPQEQDKDASELPRYRAWIVLTQTGGASSPTTDCTLQTSPDGTNFATVTSATQVTSSTTQTEFKELEALGAYIRAKTTLGGSTKPTHTAKVVVACTHPFTLQVV